MPKEELSDKLFMVQLRIDTLLSKNWAKTIKDRAELKLLLKEEKDLGAELKRLREPNNISA